MRTAYEEIYELFFDRVINDKKFFLPNVVSEEEAQEIAYKRAKSLLLESIVIVMTFGDRDCDVDFVGNRDDEMEEFTFELTLVEKQLIADIMLQRYLEKDITKRLNSLGTVFEDSDFKVYAPSNDVKSFNASLKELRELNERSINNYKKRDRSSYKVKTFNYNY